MQSSKKFKLLAIIVAVMSVIGCTKATPVAVGNRQLMIVANDERQNYSDAGKSILSGAGRDTLSIIDIGTSPLEPKLIANIVMPNTIAGPPVNLAITPDQSIALVASSLTMVPDASGALKTAPDNRLFVVDLTTSPPKIINTLTVGSEPSGLSINKFGNLALVANRTDQSVSVLRIDGKKVELVDTVPMFAPVEQVRFTTNGKRALVTKLSDHKIAILDVTGEGVTRSSLEVSVAEKPYSVDVTPDGKFALSAGMGNADASDGLVSVISTEGDYPKLIDRIAVGDTPEDLVISPTGKMAVAVLLKASGLDKDTPRYKRSGSLVSLKVDGNNVTRSNEFKMKGLSEGVVFSADGNYIYVGNYVDQNISILRVDGDTIVNTGKSMNLQGHPTAMRGKLTH